MNLAKSFVKTVAAYMTFFAIIAMAPSLVFAGSFDVKLPPRLVPALSSTSASQIKLDETLKTKFQNPKFILDNAAIKTIQDAVKSTTQGPRTGGGGNSCALSIHQATTKLVGLLKLSTGLLSPEQLSLLLRKIEAAKFYIGENLMIDGQSKDAINFPDTNQIVVSDKFCSIDMNDVSAKSMSLLLHEYLGLAKIDDKKYQISGAFLQNYTTYLSKGYSFVANVQLRNNGVWCESAAIVARQLGNSLVILTTNPKIEPFQQSMLLSLNEDQMAAFAALNDRSGREWSAPRTVRITEKTSGIEFLFTVIYVPSRGFSETLKVTMPNGKSNEYTQAQPGEPTTICYPNL